MGFLDPASWANALDTSEEDTANKAIDQQSATADRALKFQKDVYGETKDRFTPYMQAGTTALSRLQTMDSGAGFGNDPQYQKYLAEMSGMADPSRYLTDSKAIYDNPIYRAQEAEAMKGLSRSLRSLGRENSTYGINAAGTLRNKLAFDNMGRLIDLDNTRFSRLSGLAGTRYSTLVDQYNRLRDLAGSGQAAAGLTSNAGANYGNNASQTLSNLGNHQASATLAGGLMKAGQSQNSFNNGIQTINTGMKLYDMGQQNGWWGGGGSNNGSLYDDAGGDINNVDFGDDWGTWSDGTKA